MKSVTPGEFKRLLAAEFDRRGWEYGLTVGQQLLAEAERSGRVNGEELAGRLPAEFIHRTRASRSIVAAAIERAVGGCVLQPEQAQTSLVFADNRRYEVRFERGARITNSNLNVGDGKQITIDLHVSKEEVLAGIEALLRAGLTGEWNTDAAQDLATVIDSREDLDMDDVRRITLEVVGAEQPKRERARQLLATIATSGLGGALGTGISAGIGELLTRLPL